MLVDLKPFKHTEVAISTANTTQVEVSSLGKLIISHKETSLSIDEIVRQSVVSYSDNQKQMFFTTQMQTQVYVLGGGGEVDREISAMYENDQLNCPDIENELSSLIVYNKEST